ncbi:MAG: guanylate kinase [Armatimonadetes bacterium]|nr:guanylate kinase [Armatimonadota bacterium]
MSRKGILIVLSGPSGVGKDTLLERLEQVCPHIQRCVTYTTREPRQGERRGLDYNFVSEEEFRSMIARGEFLEFARVHGHLYGTPLKEVLAIREKGIDVVLKIDVQGGLTVKQKVPEAIMIFVVPPSLEELERRLRARYTDKESDIKRRCKDARKELEQIPQYDYLVINDQIESAVDNLRAIILAERARIRDDG